MNGKHYVGRDVRSLEHYDKIGPITGVSILIDEENEYVAGDMTGYVFETTCPYGTQAMANAMLDSLKGKVYNGFRATDAMLNVDAELGDGITIDGEYAMLAYQELTFGPKHTSEIAAPGESILEHEYPYVGSTQKTINRKIAQVNSKITKTAEEIKLEVSNELDGLSASLSVSLNQIRSEVSGKIDQTQAQTLINQGINGITLSASSGENQSTIYIKANGITIDSQVVTFSNIVADEVNADNIIGSLLSDQIDLYGDLTIYTNARLTTVGGYIGYTSSTLDGSAGIHIAKGNNEVRVTSNGAAIESVSSSFTAATNATVSSNNAVRLLGDGGCYSNGETITSDRRLKDKVDYDKPIKEASIIDELKPCAFEYTQWQKGKKHFGFIAQDVVELLNKYGYGETDIIVGKDPETDMYALAYTEFIPLLVSKIQQMDLRIKELEALVS